MDDDAGQPLGSANPLQLVVERQDEQIKQLKSQQKKKNKDDEVGVLLHGSPLRLSSAVTVIVSIAMSLL